MSTEKRHNLRRISALLRYPDEDFAATARCVQGEAVEDPTVHPLLVSFAAAAGSMDLMDLQAEYVRTFDMDSKNALYPVWHLYGDSPRQGRALAALLEVYREAGFAPLAGELPDYLPLMLEFTAEAPEWAGVCVWENFGSVLSALAGRLEEAGNLYAPLLSVASELLHTTDATAGSVPPEE